MNKMIRTFNSVGQGAFYTEEFYNKYNEIEFTMVYDCGSYGNEKLIINEIKHSGLKDDIDLLCISHFHADHINGLEYLLKNYNVKRILLPFLHYEERIEVFLANSDASKFIKEFSLDPAETISKYFSDKEIQITFIQPSTENNQIRDSLLIDNLEDSISSGQPIMIKNHCKWIYVPFNFRFNQRSNMLKDELNKIGINIDNFTDKYEKIKDKIIKIYKSLKGDLNTNSLVIYSGNYINNKNKCKMECFNQHFYYRYWNRSGCLYLGDYNSKGKQKWHEFKNAFKHYFKNIGTIQIPHHGSRHNYTAKLNFKGNLLSVISAGINNKFRHPHASTLKQIILKDGIPIIVTEKASSRLIQKIECY